LWMILKPNNGSEFVKCINRTRIKDFPFFKKPQNITPT
jgi:hypothetical protein